MCVNLRITLVQFTITLRLLKKNKHTNVGALERALTDMEA